MPSVQYLAQQTDHDSLRELIYTPIEEAIRLLDARQKLPHLNVSDLDVPIALQYPRIAIMSRQIATPNHEMHRVIALCEKHQLNLIVLSFQDDKFSSQNSCKHALGRMGFFNGIGRHGGKKIRYSTIINFNKYDGSPFSECLTLRGQSFVAFHHDLLLQEFPQLNTDNIIECSAWIMRQRAKTGNLYRSYLKLFLKHAILFETFLLSDSELDFTLTRALPAFREITEEFGIKPLIVHSETLELEGDDFWQLYPDHLHQFAPHDRRKTAR